MRVPDQVSKCVVFVGLPDDPDPDYRGTGFIVMVKGTENNHFAFMVTARHVAEKLEGQEFYIRVNKRDGTAVDMKGLPDNPWWYHPTERHLVDIAVTIFTPERLRELDVQPIPIEMFLDIHKAHERNIGPGDEVFITGLFTKVVGTTKNLPIVRTGNVAMMPGETIPFNGNFIEAHVIESRSIGGLSGSPVFVRPTVSMEGHGNNGEKLFLHGVGQFFFLGSVIGHWQVEPGKVPSIAEAVNMGIAPVVPAHKIREVILQGAITTIMSKINAEMRAKNQRGATLDFAPSKKSEIQTTDKGFEIPVPTSEQVLGDMKKASRKK